MESVLKYLQDSYYLNGVCFLIAFFGFIISRTSKHANLKMFAWYFIIYAFGSFLHFSNSLVLKLNSQSLIIEDFVFTIFEFCIFTYYLKSFISSKFRKAVIQYISIFYLSILFFLVLSDLLFNGEINFYTIEYTFIFQAIFLIIECLLYYFEIFKNLIFPDLINEPSFWIITGIFFCMLCTLPFSFFMNFLIIKDGHLFSQLFSIIYIFYIILFLMIIKGIYCKPVKPIVVALKNGLV